MRNLEDVVHSISELAEAAFEKSEQDSIARAGEEYFDCSLFARLLYLNGKKKLIM